MVRIGIIGNNKHHDIMDEIEELTPQEIKDMGVIDASELKDISCIKASNINTINDNGYSKQKKKPNKR